MLVIIDCITKHLLVQNVLTEVIINTSMYIYVLFYSVSFDFIISLDKSLILIIIISKFLAQDNDFPAFWLVL